MYVRVPVYVLIIQDYSIHAIFGAFFASPEYYNFPFFRVEAGATMLPLALLVRAIVWVPLTKWQSKLNFLGC